MAEKNYNPISDLKNNHWTDEEIVKITDNLSDGKLLEDLPKVPKQFASDPSISAKCYEAINALQRVKDFYKNPRAVQ